MLLKKIALANTDYVTVSADLKQFQRDQAKAQYDDSEASFQRFRAMTTASIVFGLLAGVFTFVQIDEGIGDRPRTAAQLKVVLASPSEPAHAWSLTPARRRPWPSPSTWRSRPPN